MALPSIASRHSLVALGGSLVAGLLSTPILSRSLDGDSDGNTRLGWGATLLFAKLGVMSGGFTTECGNKSCLFATSCYN